MDPLRERPPGMPYAWPIAAAPGAPAPAPPVPQASADASLAQVEAGAPWRTGDWFHAQANRFLVSDPYAPAIRDGLAPIGPLPPQTSGDWFSQQRGDVPAPDGSFFAPGLPPGLPPGQAGTEGGQTGQNQDGDNAWPPPPPPEPFPDSAPPGQFAAPPGAMPFPAPAPETVPPQPWPGQESGPPAGSLRPDYAQLATMQAAPGTAIVQIGDSLPRIARRLLGDESRWVEIFELNRDQILDPDVVLPGMVLRLPAGPKPAHPPRPPAPNPRPPRPPSPAEPSDDAEALRRVTPQQLAHLGATDKARFFAVLKPAALAAERKYGVPWQVTLAQVALESGWGRHAIGGYNVFGIKGSGPAGSVVKSTKEWRGGRYVTENARFARYNDFHEAVMEHGKLFHNGYYNKALRGFERDRDPVAFARNIHGIYATSPTYAQNLTTIMRQYGLV